MKNLTIKIALLGFLIAFVSSVLAVDCNACEDKCKWNDPSCPKKKLECKKFAATFDQYLVSVKNWCANAPGRMDEREKINNTEKLLIARGYFEEREFKDVEVRWCPIRGRVFNGIDFGADGMALGRNLIILDNTLKNDSAQSLAPLLAHEMIHVRQYIRWGNEGFKCHYACELASGHGTGRRNSIEREAYEFQDKVNV